MALLLVIPASGQANTAKRRQTLLLLKVLTYDYFLGRRHKQEVHVGVLYLASNARSAKRSAEIHRTMSNLKMTVAGRRVRASLLPYSSFANGKTGGVGTIVVCDGLNKSQLDKVLSYARKAKVLIVGGNRAYVEQGVAAATVVQGDRIKILVNRRAAASQGSKFASRLLSLAEMVD